MGMSYYFLDLDFMAFLDFLDFLGECLRRVRLRPPTNEGTCGTLTG